MSRIRDHRSNRYVSGDHLIVCARSGRTILASDARKEWTGHWVHKSLWEAKHPSLIYTHVPTDKQTVSQPIRTEQANTFVTTGVQSVYVIGVHSLLDSVYD